MHTLRLSAALTAALAAAGCADQPGPVIEVPDADDRLVDFDFEPEVTEVIPLDDVRLDAVVTVIDADDTKADDGEREKLLVSGPLYTVGVPGDGLMDIRVTTRGLKSWLTDDLQFMLLRPSDDGRWEPVPVLVSYYNEGVATASRLETFDSLVYDTGTGRVTVEHGALGEFTTDDVTLRDLSELAVFAVPASTWGNLRGDYDYRLEVSCGGEACTAAQAPNPQDPQAPDVEGWRHDQILGDDGAGGGIEFSKH